MPLVQNVHFKIVNMKNIFKRKKCWALKIEPHQLAKTFCLVNILLKWLKNASCKCMVPMVQNAIKISVCAALLQCYSASSWVMTKNVLKKFQGQLDIFDN